LNNATLLSEVENHFSRAVLRCNGSADNSQCNLLKSERVVSSLCSRDKRKQRLRWWKTRHCKHQAASTRNRGDDLLEIVWVELEREAAIADPVLVTAFEMGPRIAEQKCPRGEGRASLSGTVPKGASSDGGHTECVVPLLDRPILGTGS